MTNPSWVSARMERGTVLLFVAAGLVMGLALALPAIRAAVDLAGGEGAISLLTDAQVPRSPSAEGATIVSANYESARVVASGLSSQTRLLLVLGAAFGALTTLLTVSAVVLFFLLLMWRRPFHRALILATQVAGSALLLGGMLSAGLGGLGRMMAADELNPSAGDVFIIGFAFDPAWTLVGLGVLALSVVFTYGTRLQRDTEGLV
ncbi:MAG: cation transport ATPase [Microbacterium sp.]|nr:cation transport ATPase [Microbacterium sp.]